jgi:hypothetical protein
MKNNLTPPFAMREAGITANATPKIQTIEPTEEDHSTCFPESDFRIPLSSWGMFSCFVTTKPTADQMMESEDVCILAPSRMNPHCDSHENMLDWDFNVLMRRKDRVQILLSEAQDDVAMAASVHISSTEAKVANTVLERRDITHDEEPHPC